MVCCTKMFLLFSCKCTKKYFDRHKETGRIKKWIRWQQLHKVLYKAMQLRNRHRHQYILRNRHQPKFWNRYISTLRARAHWPLCLATGGRVFVAGIFIPVGNHYFQVLASALQFVVQVCDRLWLVPATTERFCGCVPFSNNNFLCRRHMSP